MVGLVLVSHSARLAEGLRDLVTQLARLEGRVAAAGGAADGRLGTSAEAIRRALDAVDGPDGVLVLMDLGSAVLTAELVLEELLSERHARTLLADAPFVEGAIAAAMQAALGGSLAEVREAAEAAARIPKLAR